MSMQKCLRAAARAPVSALSATRLAGAAALLAAVLLAGCTRGPERSSAELEVVRAAGQYIARRRSTVPPASDLTRALLDQQTQAYLEVVIENRDAKAYLTRPLSRRDGFPGGIEVWRTADNVSLALRAGMVIATRGLGNGLLSADVPAAAGVAGPARGGARSYVLRARGNGQIRLQMACRLHDLGPARIEIVELGFATRHLQEQCSGGGGSIVNDYWVGTGAQAGRVWQSRQWAGPGTGYVRIRQLRL
ncbi:YjbF family lipoprotein [Cribrihabitans pelagius]|uniref:YjbF family lipoprotein n=1 Tax=Cribrihabitans pelagius TaxID=1765746 RepID=UPI003B5945E7